MISITRNETVQRDQIQIVSLSFMQGFLSSDDCLKLCVVFIGQCYCSVLVNLRETLSTLSYCLYYIFFCPFFVCLTSVCFFLFCCFKFFFFNLADFVFVGLYLEALPIVCFVLVYIHA